MPDLELKSPNDGSTMAFTVNRRYTDGIDFDFAIRTPWFSGRGASSTYLNGSPGVMFRDMASQWKGWKGTKSWQDLDGRVTLDATSDSTGHTTISVELVGGDDVSKLRVAIQFEAGQLDDMAYAITELLG
jgi:endo-1,4-beta-mannosidase